MEDGGRKAEEGSTSQRAPLGDEEESLPFHPDPPFDLTALCPPVVLLLS